jgi:CofD-related protein of GAK system
MTESQTIKEIKFNKRYKIPDKYLVVRCLKAPEAGPKVLFFSGGTALRKLSRTLINYTYNSIHIITPFDSGGSSAEIRKAFNMLSIGDIRNRIISIADRSIQGNPDVYKLFSYRLDKSRENEQLKIEISEIIDGKHELISVIPDPMRKIIRNYLKFFYSRMTADFNLRGANIGNLVLTGGYLNSGEHIDPVIFIFSKLVEARAVVRPVSSKYLELAAVLENGKTVIGQHLLTGKESSPLESPIKELFLTTSKETGKKDEITRIELSARKKITELIYAADLICYPMGSFYTSLIANFLVKGIGQAISENPCIKVYIPNTGNDPEQSGMTLSDSVCRILEYLRKSCIKKVVDEKLLNFIILDIKNGIYPPMGELKKFKNISLIDTPLMSDESYPNIDAIRLSEVLVSLSS